MFSRKKDGWLRVPRRPFKHEYRANANTNTNTNTKSNTNTTSNTNTNTFIGSRPGVPPRHASLYRAWLREEAKYLRRQNFRGQHFWSSCFAKYQLTSIIWLAGWWSSGHKRAGPKGEEERQGWVALVIFKGRRETWGQWRADQFFNCDTKIALKLKKKKSAL